MDLTPHVTGLQATLEDVAGEDEAGQAMADRMAAALAPALHLQLLDLLGEVALEVSSQLPDGRLDLQLAGREAVLVYRSEQAPPSPRLTDDDSETARLTVRMPESLKSAIEAAAESESVSVNSWLVGAARLRLSPTSHRTPNSGTTARRITGYVQG